MIEVLVGLHVTDETKYAAYRSRMTPMLERCGGGFGYDFRVSDVLIAQTPEPINRVFTIRFPDRETQASFFADETYLAIKKELFEPAVANTTIIATYDPSKAPGS